MKNTAEKAEVQDHIATMQRPEISQKDPLLSDTAQQIGHLDLGRVLACAI